MLGAIQQAMEYFSANAIVPALEEEENLPTQIAQHSPEKPRPMQDALQKQLRSENDQLRREVNQLHQTLYKLKN